MKLFIAALIIAAIGVASPAPAAKPAAHTLPDCPAVPEYVWMEYKPDTWLGPNGHYGPAGTLTCNPTAANRVHIKHVPGSWSLGTAQSYCADAGSYIAGRFGGTSFVCPDVDF